jgi:predicted P-loop ATPase
LIIYGEGGVGKNTFVKEVLGTIFGPHQVLVADAEKTLGQFNGLIQGKTVVMIDEAIAEKVNVERLRRTVGNRTVDVNPKYGKQGEHDNTALYLAGGNDSSGPILLAGDATDRRWSIIRVEKSIIQRLADDRKCSFDEALELYKLMEHVYTDKEEVAKWLN